MFYDPTCKPETKADPYSLEVLIGWLEKQPNDATYNYFSINGSCLIGLYGADTGIGEKWHDCHHAFYMRDELWIAAERPYTCGSALTRARASKNGMNREDYNESI